MNVVLHLACTAVLLTEAFYAQALDQDAPSTLTAVPFPDVRNLISDVLPPSPEPVSVADLVTKVSSENTCDLGTRSYSSDNPIHELFLARDPKDLPLFRALLDSKNDCLRGAACVYLGRLHDQKSFEGIARLTKDENKQVRRMAVEALGKLGLPEAVPFLLAIGDDTSNDVQSELPEALFRTPGTAASLALLDLYITHTDAMRFASFADYLEKRRDSSTIPGLISNLDSGNPQRSQEIHSLLRALTEQDIGGSNVPDPAQFPAVRAQWEAWWETSKTNFQPVPHVEAVPETTYHGMGLVIKSAVHGYLDNLVSVEATPTGENGGGVPFRMTDGTPIVVPVDDNSIESIANYVLYEDGREVERGALESTHRFPRYCTIPFGSIAQGIRFDRSEFAPRVPPGDYEIQIELRALCIALMSFDYMDNVWGSGPIVPTGEVFTLKSNRYPLTIHPPTSMAPESVTELAEAMGNPNLKYKNVSIAYKALDGTSFFENVTLYDARAAAWRLRFTGSEGLSATLEHFEPVTATREQLEYLHANDDPRAQSALERSRVAGNKAAQSLLQRPAQKTVPELLVIATRAVGSPDWSWAESRDALEGLDRKLGPQDTQYTQALIHELEGRLDSSRDLHILRPGESLWGAFRTAFLLGQIGQTAAVPVLKRATESAAPNLSEMESTSRCVLLRWYGATALKLIDVQQLPRDKQDAEIDAWIRHCFSSPEEHFMAQARLLPYLRNLLGDRAHAFFVEIAPTLSDPWMAADALRLAGTV